MERCEIILGILWEKILNPCNRVLFEDSLFFLDVSWGHPVLYWNVGSK